MRVMKASVRRILSLLLCAALAVPAVFSFDAASYAAAEDGDTAAVKETAYHVYDTPDIVYYSDDFFRGDSEPYNTSLSAMSFMVCNMTYGTGRAQGDQSRNLREFLNDNGFTDFDVNDDYREAASLESSAVACAHKQITDGGKTYTLLAVIPRSGTFGKEFERSLLLGKSGNDTDDHAGYDACKDKVVAFVRQYIKEYGIKGDLKVWTTGYSGGGGVSDLFAAELIRYPAYVVGNPSFSSADLYCYNFSPMRAASADSDPRNAKYACIHNIYDDADILSILPTSDRFDRYGTDYKFRDYAGKSRVLELMKMDSPETYDSYVNGGDPDLFTAMKPDAEELRKGRLVIVEDADSYIPNDQAAYLRSVEETIEKICAREGGGDSRKGFVNAYQQPMMDLVGFFFENGINYNNINILVSAMTDTETSMPMLLCMYTSFLVGKSIDDQSGEFDRLIEESFNRMASVMENGDGSIKARYSRSTAYQYVRDNYFTKDEDGTYRLTGSLDITERGLLLNSLRKLTGVLYARSFGDALTAAGKDSETIDRLTSEESSEAVSWFLANLMFGNSLQSKKIEPLKLDNEQFCQLATFAGNASRYVTMHMFYSLFSWYRAADPYYDDFCKGTEAQCTGYRRVFIALPEGSYESGTVTDGSGRTVASFKDGKLLSRSDQWIGWTTSDSGGWLRLPIDQSYKVSVTLSKDAAASLKVDDYSITDGAVKRSVTADSSGSWQGMSVSSGEILTLDIPAADAADPTGAVYTLSRKEKTDNAQENSSPSQASDSSSSQASGSGAAKTATIFSKAVPSVKNMKAKAGKGYFTVSWKKLSAKKLKKISGVQLQYSTNKSFKGAKTVSLSKSRKSYKAKKLKKGKTYYIRMRNVRKSGSKYYVSAWSARKKIKIR